VCPPRIRKRCCSGRGVKKSSRWKGRHVVALGAIQSAL
jgi:hypothetical protein